MILLVVLKFSLIEIGMCRLLGLINKIYILYFFRFVVLLKYICYDRFFFIENRFLFGNFGDI